MILLGPEHSPYDLNFRLFRVAVRVSPWFWLISAILSWKYVEIGFRYLFIAVACIFVSILIHELGHVFMGRLFGTDGHIVLYSFGGLAIGSNDVPYRWQRIAVSFAGPLAQLVLWGIIVALEPDWKALRESTDPGGLPYLRASYVAVEQLEWINLVWPLLNLLPVWPLDGGQISREILEGANPRKGLRWSLGLSLFCAGLMAANALVELMTKTPLIPYIDGGIWSLLLFGSLAFSSYQALQQLPAEHGRDRDDDYRSGGRAPWEQDPDYWKR